MFSESLHRRLAMGSEERGAGRLISLPDLVGLERRSALANILCGRCLCAALEPGQGGIAPAVTTGSGHRGVSAPAAKDPHQDIA